jgi:hypothetical protein
VQKKQLEQYTKAAADKPSAAAFICPVNSESKKTVVKFLLHGNNASNSDCQAHEQHRNGEHSDFFGII